MKNMSRHTAVIVSLLLLSSCIAGQEQEGVEDNDMRKLVAAQTSNMFTTGTLYTDQTVNPIPNLQVGPLEAGEYTIQFEVLPPADGFGYFAQAIIDWKVEGHQLRRVISVNPGAVVSGVAEAVDIKIVDFSGPISNFLSPTVRNPKPYQVFASLSKGTRPDFGVPVVLDSTYPQIIPVSSTTSSIPIPANAGVTSVLVTVVPFDAAPAVLGVQDIIVHMNGTVGLNPTVKAYMPLAQQTGPGWVPIAPGSTNITIENRNAAVRAEAFILWGVEG